MPGLPDPARAKVIGQWEKVFGSPPPPYLSVPFMRKALAYDEQCRRFGGLSAASCKALKRIAAGKPLPPMARPGAHLMREWNGRTYQVEVLADAYRLDGKTWTSLSAIARHITGTSWSGPRFFGLSTASGGRS